MEEQFDVKNFVRIVRRRKGYFLGTALAVLLITAMVTILLPPVYKSEATILVEAQEIPEDMVRSTVTGYVEERLQAINQLVLSRSNLLEVINRFDLYPKLRRTSSTEEIITTMRENIHLEPVQTEVSNPESGRQGTATVAFTLSYEGKDPRKVAQVANRLVSLFLEENSKMREEKAETTVDFLDKQLSELRLEIAQYEEHIAVFKDKHLLALPEMMELNLHSLQRYQERIDKAQEDIKKLQDRKIYLQGQLATLEPSKYTMTLDGQRVMTPEEELKQLRSSYLSLKAAHSSEHPDVVRFKKQLEALEKEVQVRDQLQTAKEELAGQKKELSKLKETYSDLHPDVIQADKKLRLLEANVKDLASRQEGFTSNNAQPDNPSYINLQTQIKSTEMEIGAVRQSLKDLQAKSEELRKRIELTPKVEQEYSALQRDYANAQDKYRETKSRLLAARESQNMETSRVAQKLTLIDPPAMPEEPFKPNRLALLLIGAVLSLGFGIGAGSLSEFMDPSVYTPKELSAVCQYRILGAVPYMETKQDRLSRVRKRLAVIVACLAALVAGLLAVHFLVRPLDVVWVQIIQKLGLWF